MKIIPLRDTYMSLFYFVSGNSQTAGDKHVKYYIKTDNRQKHAMSVI
jgi:hypothetical protein